MLEEVRTGATNPEIAVRLGISISAVKFHVGNMLDKLELANRRELATWRPEAAPTGAGRNRLLAPLAFLTGLAKPVAVAGLVAGVGGAALVAGVLIVALVSDDEPASVSGERDRIIAADPDSEDPQAVAVTTSTSTPTPTLTSTPAATPTPVATATPIATATPTVTPSPTPTVREPQGELPTIRFWGDIPETEQASVRARVADVVEFFDARYGIRLPGLTFHIGEDIPVLEEATEEVWGTAQVVNGGVYSEGTIFVLLSAATLAIEHEYFHAMQDHLAPNQAWGPWWVVEGAAEYAALLYRDARGEQAYADAIDFDRWAVSYEHAPLEDFEEVVWALDGAFSLATLGVDWLVGKAGEDSLIAYFRILPDRTNWEEAFEEAFDLSLADVYPAFAAYRADVAGIRREVRGVVLGPDGEPVSRWRIDIEAFPRGSNRQWDLREDSSSEGRDGTFTSRLPDGTYELSLMTRCPPGWVDLGWYGGESGFTTDHEEAAHVVVDGADVEGIVIRLPAQPSELSARCDPGPRRTLRGTVSYPDGSPIPGLTVDAYNFNDSVEPDTTLVAADGTFVLEVPDATYQLNVREPCEIWLGTYDVANDSFYEPPIHAGTDVTQLDLVVDGEDISGIEIVVPSGPLHALAGRTLAESMTANAERCQ